MQTFLSSQRSRAGLVLLEICVLSATCQATGWSSSGDHSNADDHERRVLVQDQRINESSGLAASRTHADAMWVHNDSGDAPRLFLLEADGSTRSVVLLQSADAVDWEDMCSFQSEETPWLLIADVGDNGRRRTAERDPCRLYLLREPENLDVGEVRTLAPEVRITFDWPCGPIDCEGVAVDTQRNEILLLEKGGPLQSRLFRLPLNLKQPDQTLTADLIATAALPFATAIDIDPHGHSLVVVFMWSGVQFVRESDEDWAAALQRPPRGLPLPRRKQGETVCFTIDGKSLLLNSEGRAQPLWIIPLPD